MYIHQPSGFINPLFPSFICKLRTSLYGLKQAPRAWLVKLSDALLILGFNPSSSDSSLFSFRQGNQFVFILVYVDDLLVVSSNHGLAEKFITALSSKFSVKDLGPIHYFLGNEVQRHSDGFHLSQTQYIRDLCARVNMHNSKVVSTPMAITTPPLSSSTFSDPSLHRSVVGGLQYLAFT